MAPFLGLAMFFLTLTALFLARSADAQNVAIHVRDQHFPRPQDRSTGFCFMAAPGAKTRLPADQRPTSSLQVRQAANTAYCVSRPILAVYPVRQPVPGGRDSLSNSP